MQGGKDKVIGQKVQKRFLLRYYSIEVQGDRCKLYGKGQVQLLLRGLHFGRKFDTTVV